jgi:hypothetical protein
MKLQWLFRVSGSGNSMAIPERLHLETGSQKFKMAATKLEVCISASIQDIKEIPTANCVILGSGNLMTLLVILYLETGSEKFKMAAAKTGFICISASIRYFKEIATATPCF